MSRVFAKLRLFLWGLAAGVIGLYFYGLFFGAYGPLELGLLSFGCIALIALFTVHEIRLRRELKIPEVQEEQARIAHTQRERRGF